MTEIMLGISLGGYVALAIYTQYRLGDLSRSIDALKQRLDNELKHIQTDVTEIKERLVRVETKLNNA